MLMRACLITALLILCLRSHAGTVPIDDFRSIDAWSMHPDGGSVEVSQQTLDGKPCLHLTFTAQGFGWGNAARAVTLPPNAVGVEYDLYVISAKPESSMFVWLFEKDGDGHVGFLNLDGKPLGQIAGGWHHCFIPLAAFRYEGRGNKVRELLTTDKMLIGLGTGAAEVLVSNLAFRVSEKEASIVESRTPDLKIEDGRNGRVAVLRDDFGKEPSFADPDVLGGTLSKSGYGVTYLRSGDLADPAVLSPKNFDCLVLPYGPRYPYAAFDSIREYLKAGGSLFSTGGYALDEPCTPDASGKLLPLDLSMTLTAEALDREMPERWLNTRHGRPGDTMGIDRAQIGIFDPTYHLLNVSQMRSAPMQWVIPSSVDEKTRLEGYAACSMLGSNHPIAAEKWGRHVPLVQASDEFGRLRGDVGSIAHNYAGPFRGSSWAFFGVTNTDLFARKRKLLASLPAIIDAVTRKVYLHSLATDLACYRDGETVKLSCSVSDFGRTDASGSIVFRVSDRAGREVYASKPLDISLSAGEEKTLAAEFVPDRFTSDLYRVEADLTVGGKIVDRIESGFLVYSPDVTSEGLKLKFRGNYFRDGDRPVLLSGTNETGAIFYSGNENPLVWDRDLVRMSECGINVLRVMHLERALTSIEGKRFEPLDMNMDRLPLRAERWFDGLVQLCQKHRIVLFMGLTSFGAVLSDEELAAERHFEKLIAERYKDVPGFMIDIQNEPSTRAESWSSRKQWEPVLKVWNDFLREKYGTDEALKEAWKASPPETPIGSIPCTPGTQAWDDIRTLDYDLFSDYLIRRWTAENRAGVKAGDPDMPVTVGYLQEYWALNKIRCMDSLDFANMHSYTGIDVLRADLKLFDRRFEGKSLSLGEFGSHADHEKRIRGEDSPCQDWWRYLMTGHYLFGEGGSMLTNWCWKDMDDVVFPWGINYGCGGPGKELLLAMRNQSLLFRQVWPTYKPPNAWLVVPSLQMLGTKGNAAIRLLYRTVDKLLDDHLDFGTIDDEHLAELPSNARVLIYPIPFAVPDDAYARLKALAEGGGTVVITGDVRYDALRRPTQNDRLVDLCGVRFVSEVSRPMEWTDAESPCIIVEPMTAESHSDGTYLNRIGAGEVVYSPKPLLLGDFSSYLGKQGLRSDVSLFTRVEGGGHAFRIDEPDGGGTVVLTNLQADPRTVSVYEGNLGKIEIPLAGNGTGLVRFHEGKKLLAIEAQGPVRMEGWTLDMKGHFAVYSCDGEDLRSSREMVVLPFGGGELDLGARAAGLIVQTGEVVGGKWRVLSESTGGTISASGSTVFDIRIVAPKDRLEALGKLVASEMMLSR